MPSNDIKGTTALVTGASRGFGRGIAAALDGAGAAGRRGRPRWRRAGGTACRTRRVLHPGERRRGRPHRGRAAHRRLPARHSRAQRGRRAAVGARSSITPGRRSAATGTWTSSRCSTGCARRCSPRSRRAARSSRCPAGPPSGARRCPAATPGQRPRSGSSPRTPRRNPAGRARHQVHLGAAAADPRDRARRRGGRRLRRQGGHGRRRLPGTIRPGPDPGAGGRGLRRPRLRSWPRRRPLPAHARPRASAP